MRPVHLLLLLTLLSTTGCSLRPAARASTEPSEAEPAKPRSETGSTKPSGKVLEGKASYYSDRLAGRSTASGEPYDPKKLTAAHLTLRFGTRIKVTRVDTGASVIVKVNDRGPYGNRGRIVDLSRKAAEKLDMIRAGVVQVRVEILDP